MSEEGREGSVRHCGTSLSGPRCRGSAGYCMGTPSPFRTQPGAAAGQTAPPTGTGPGSDSPPALIRLCSRSSPRTS